jgi:hypothetical protein
MRRGHFFAKAPAAIRRAYCQQFVRLNRCLYNQAQRKLQQGPELGRSAGADDSYPTSLATAPDGNNPERFISVSLMSALLSIADVERRHWNVRFGP